MTSPHTQRGRVYRRCACRHAGKQLGARCPELTSNARHGTWTFAVDMPSLTGKRATLRRGGHPTRKAATAALTRVLDCERAGLWLDDRQTVADYLTTWLTEKSRTLKPTTASLTDLFEVLIGTGLRKGEALALHWADVHLDEAVLFVRYTTPSPTHLADIGVSGSLHRCSGATFATRHQWVSRLSASSTRATWFLTR